ncbi:MAG TPA: TIGR03986 family CRISPR-associated RAMP protein [Candidatus Limnocylindrales bacterium]|nr:TIGR03986 family CRISPR-associated RAMP protein [Candidatus Limnocylindrales bacterium]
MSNRTILNLPRHKNPVNPNGKLKPNRTASAPYNFVPLPEVVVTAVDHANDLPDHDRYYPDRHTGYFEVTLMTKSPLYVRCPFTLPEFLRQERGEDKDSSYLQQVKNTPHFFYTRDPNQPVIPGSSLRGMLRSVLEIVSYGKVQWVTDSLKIFYRAVAAAKDDPLGEPYRKIIGKFGSNVQAGYLIKKGDEWYVKPAKKPADMGWPEKGAYLKVKEDSIHDNALPGLIRFNSPHYRPQYHPVSFDVDIRKGKKGNFITITRIGPSDAGYPYRGILVCSGNMREAGSEEVVSPRKRHALVLEAIEGKKLLKINNQAVTDYLDALTPFQIEPPFDRYRGCLRDGYPIFYVEVRGEVLFFGHTPNFRVPAFIENDKRTATPLDFVPKALRYPEHIDYAEALFGFVRTRPELDDMKQRGVIQEIPKQGDKHRAYAGRVFVTDAILAEGQSDIWFSQNPIVPSILASPKPTAFQHYLVQTSDDKNTLHHYGDKTPEETVIRGHKLYWHQGDRTRQDIEDPNAPATSTQHTQFRPVKPGVTFTFRIYFENLSDRELGALCWALHPLGNSTREYCHHLGMGKPLGMGAVKLEAVLYLTNRPTRYGSLFNGDTWQTGTSSSGESLSDRTTLERRTHEFEQHVLEVLNPNTTCQHLYELKRIGMLLKMMEWPGFKAVPPVNGQAAPNNCVITENGRQRPNTRYMMIELPGVQGTKKNEYRDRPVLPDPCAFDPHIAEPISDTTKVPASKLTTPSQDLGSTPAAKSLIKTTPKVSPKVQKPKQEEVTTKREWVTLVEDVKGGKAKVQTEGGEIVSCSNFPLYPMGMGTAGMRCRADVTRQDGKVQRAIFKGWE